MQLKELSRNWDRFGREAPLEAILANRDGENWTEEGFHETGRAEIAETLAILAALERPTTAGRALDFGCGIGRLTQPLAEVYREAVGIDVAPSMIERANEINRHPRTCWYLVNTVDNLSCIGDRTCDLVHTRYVLQHMPPRNALRYVAEFHRIVADGGVITFQLQTRPEEGHGVVEWMRYGRRLVRRCIPQPVLRLYRRARYGGEQPVMERHAIPRSTIERAITGHGGRILREDHDSLDEAGWASSTYWVGVDR